MVSYDFDKIIDRRNTDCLKYDFAVQRGRPQDVLPFWVADMDFPIAQEITEALVQRCQHGILATARPRTLILTLCKNGITSIFIGRFKDHG